MTDRAFQRFLWSLNKRELNSGFNHRIGTSENRPRQERILWFHWTMLFFGGLVPLFRGDVVMGLLLILLQLFTWGFGTSIFAFFYKKQYASKLIEQEYVLAESEGENAIARSRIGILQAA